MYENPIPPPPVSNFLLKLLQVHFKIGTASSSHNDVHCETELKALGSNIAFSSFGLFSFLLSLIPTLNYLLFIIISEISETL